MQLFKTAASALLALSVTAAPDAHAAAQPAQAVMRAFNGTWARPPAPPAPPPAPGQARPPESTVNDRRFPPALEARLLPGPKAAYDKFKSLAANVVDKEPPTPDNNCLPFAMPGETVSTGFPMLLHVTPKVIGILMQIDTQMRLVHMDKEHPADLKPSFHGHSVGRWEGDTLVIDTVGFDPRAQFSDGYIHGPNLRALERYRVIDDGKTLERTFTFTDPDSLKEPYSFTRLMRRTDEPFQEYLNAQNNTLYECPTAERGSGYRPVQ